MFVIAYSSEEVVNVTLRYMVDKRADWMEREEFNLEFTFHI